MPLGLSERHRIQNRPVVAQSACARFAAGGESAEAGDGSTMRRNTPRHATPRRGERAEARFPIMLIPGWSAADIPLLAVLPALVVASGLFSGSETALFGLRGHHLTSLRSRRTPASRAALALIREPNMLLITLLLGNMLVNVLFFVISSVLILHVDMERASPAVPILFGAASLLAIILAAEVAPKLVAADNALRWVLLVSVPLLVLHDLILPLRLVVSNVIIQPMIRLVGPRRDPERIHLRELGEFIEMARKRGDIDPNEKRLLRDIVELRRLKVRDVMKPRVKLVALSSEVTDRREIIALARRSGERYLPVYRDTLDHITGMLDLREYLLGYDEDLADPAVAINACSVEPTFIPELATLDHLLTHFRSADFKAVVAVDEYGQTAGVATLPDVIDELIDVPTDEPDVESPARIMLIGLGRWRLAPELSVYDFAEAFDINLEEPRVSTVAGLILEHLGDTARLHDEVRIDSWRLRITGLEGPRITEIEVERVEE